MNKQQLLGFSLVVLVEGTVRPPGYCQDVATQETQVNQHLMFTWITDQVVFYKEVIVFELQ